MEETTANFQAHLLESQKWYCYVGERNAEAPACSSMTAAEVLRTSSCNCSDSFQQQVVDHFHEGDNKRVIYFLPKQNLVTDSARLFLTLQLFFSYNSSTRTPTLGYPNLWLLVYDPIQDPYIAYQTGDALMTLMDANGVTTLTLSSDYVDFGNGTAYYRYDVGVSTSPFMNLICDVAGNTSDYRDCHATVLVRVPRLERTVVHDRRVMLWTDVVASAGAYFALVQLISWIISGLSWAI
jgi:hypothetical protein